MAWRPGNIIAWGQDKNPGGDEDKNPEVEFTNLFRTKNSR
jgi:hypothetical protein